MEDTAILLIVVVFVVIGLAFACWQVAGEVKAWFANAWPNILSYGRVSILP